MVEAKLRRGGAVQAEAVRQHVLFFYGGPFSQFHRAGFVDPETGEHFEFAEKWMMAGKAGLFGDAAGRAKIMRAAVVKRLGREVRGFKERVWDKEKFDVVVRGSLLKFGQNPRLAGLLEDTGCKILVEASPNDRIWGIGLNEHRARSGERWRGENLLGEALMVARHVLREGSGRDPAEAEILRPATNHALHGPQPPEAVPPAPEPCLPGQPVRRTPHEGETG